MAKPVKFNRTHDELMAYIMRQASVGPVFGPTLERIAMQQFGKSATSLSARLRELRQNGYLSQRSASINGSKRKYVCYWCSDQQYAAYKSHRAESAGGGAPPPSLNAAGSASASDGEQLTLGDMGETPGHWQR